MLDITTTDDGVLLPIKAFPKARTNEIKGVHNGRLKVAVTAAPEKGKANSAIITLVAKQLGASKNDVELLRGNKSQLKTVLVRGLGRDGVLERLSDRRVQA